MCDGKHAKHHNEYGYGNGVGNEIHLDTARNTDNEYKGSDKGNGRENGAERIVSKNGKEHGNKLRKVIAVFACVINSRRIFIGSVH